ncbi:hypothetical protein ANN_10687 [Periplaneta americana]|uniref:DDE Tnp4 domain-containing protein n=1 Tax=Periplaneta americana TaxID=6978 RepID=A0ABQ8T4M3_PERAM|nr:hypothetical protein ANN_10687 [Periplaneta americana]
MGSSTVGLIVKETVEILWKILQPLHMPVPTSDTFRKIAEEYFNVWNFPNCLGAIDGKHIRINCPAHSGTMYFNYKHFYSIVLQAVVDANYRFTIIDVGGYGKQSDGGTFRSSDMYKLLKNKQLNIPLNEYLPSTNTLVPFVFMGDEAYPLLENLLKPYSGENLEKDSECFNKRLSRARKTVECAFGILYSKWRIFSKAIETTERTADNIVKACCVLQNMVIDKEGVQRHLKDIVFFPAEMAMQRPQHSGRTADNAKLKRDTFKIYICNNEIGYL